MLWKDGRMADQRPGLLALDEMPPRLWGRYVTEAGASGAEGERKILPY